MLTSYYAIHVCTVSYNILTKNLSYLNQRLMQRFWNALPLTPQKQIDNFSQLLVIFGNLMGLAALRDYPLPYLKDEFLC